MHVIGMTNKKIAKVYQTVQKMNKILDRKKKKKTMINQVGT